MKIAQQTNCRRRREPTRCPLPVHPISRHTPPQPIDFPRNPAYSCQHLRSAYAGRNPQKPPIYRFVPQFVNRSVVQIFIGAAGVSGVSPGPFSCVDKHPFHPRKDDVSTPRPFILPPGKSGPPGFTLSHRKSWQGDCNPEGGSHVIKAGLGCSAFQSRAEFCRS